MGVDPRFRHDHECPVCHTQNRYAENVTSKEIATHGDISFCATCGEAFRFDDGMRAVPLSRQDLFVVHPFYVTVYDLPALMKVRRRYRKKVAN